MIKADPAHAHSQTGPMANDGMEQIGEPGQEPPGRMWARYR